MGKGKWPAGWTRFAEEEFKALAAALKKGPVLRQSLKDALSVEGRRNGVSGAVIERYLGCLEEAR